MKPLIVAMTGATGAIYGIRLLEVLREKAIEVHLVISPWAEKTISLETDYSVEEVKNLAAVVHGMSINLIIRAADVMLKEKRKLILVPRESPLNLIHLKNLVSAAEAGAIILPPMAAFYFRPQTIADLVDHLVEKILDILGIEHRLFHRWGE